MKTLFGLSLLLGSLAYGAMDLTINNVDCVGMVQTATSVSCATNFTQGGLDWLLIGGGSNSPGSATSAQTESAAVHVVNNSGVTQTVTIRITANNFLFPTAPPPLILTSGIGDSVNAFGSGSSTDEFGSCVDPSNSLTGCLALVVASNSTETGEVSTNLAAASDNASNSTLISALNSPYAISEILQLTLAPGENMNFSASTTLATTVPEPAGVVLFGTLLLGATIIARKRKRARTSAS